MNSQSSSDSVAAEVLKFGKRLGVELEGVGTSYSCPAERYGEEG